MAAKNKGAKAARRAQRAERYRKRVPIQPDGMPSGKHLAGFKGTKTEGICLCAGCNPNSNAGQTRVIG